MDYLAVYLAGKISFHGWRERIVKGIDDSVGDIYEKTYAETKIDGLITTGPFFIRCDHGCYHGKESHGVGSYEPGDEFADALCSGEGIPKSVVSVICRKQIDKSNFVFAYIDSETCYGTLLEIGYAIGKHKPVAVLFANDQLKKDMWFVSESANIVFDRFGLVQRAEIDNIHVFSTALKIAEQIIAGGDPAC